MAKNENAKTGILFVIAAPSGAGKTSLIKEVTKRLEKKHEISKVPTCTTRPPRTGEVDKKDYYFLSPDEFIEKQKNGEFLETTEYNGKLYGSPLSFLDDLKLGKSFIIITDLQGVKNLSKLIKDRVSIWIETKNIEELRRRILKRGSISEQQIEQRLKLAEEEMVEAEKSRLLDYHVVNDVFEQTVEELILLIKDKLLKNEVHKISS